MAPPRQPLVSRLVDSLAGRLDRCKNLMGAVEDGVAVAVRRLIALEGGQLVRSEAFEPSHHLGGGEGVVASEGALDDDAVRRVGVRPG